MEPIRLDECTMAFIDESKNLAIVQTADLDGDGGNVKRQVVRILDPMKLAQAIGYYLAQVKPERGAAYAARQSPGEAEAAVLLDRSGRPL